MKKNILFITWDGPQTTYIEGLFLPIFHKIEELYPQFKFHVLQYTWGGETATQNNAANLYQIPYKSVNIPRKPMVTLGSIYTLFTGTKVIKKYIDLWNIDALMPRSYFPAFMANMGNFNLPIIYDADGLPIEERIDFAGLKRNSLMHKVLVSIEKDAIIKSKYVLTRTSKSIAYHKKNYSVDDKKFYKVINGRDSSTFKPNKNYRKEIRAKFGLSENALLFVYAGSFGPQYGWSEMLNIFESYLKENSDAHFLFLTGSPEKVSSLVPINLKHHFTLLKVPYQSVPHYLSAADIAFAIRQPKPSMEGVSPIKLGEYLLMDLPTIASKGIGDTEDLLMTIPGIFLYNHFSPPIHAEINKFIEQSRKVKPITIREAALDSFSLEAAAKSYNLVLKQLT